MRNLKKFNLIIVSLSLVGGLVSCGKSPKQQDEQIRSQLKASVDEKETQLNPIVGQYEGTLVNEDNAETPEQIRLVLVPSIMIVQNPGRNDVTEMPTLGGNVNVYLDPSRNREVVAIAQFSNSTFNPESGHLRLTGFMVAGANGQVQNTFDGYVRENRIQGVLSNTVRGVLGRVDVKKVSP